VFWYYDLSFIPSHALIIDNSFLERPTASSNDFETEGSPISPHSAGAIISTLSKPSKPPPRNLKTLLIFPSVVTPSIVLALIRHLAAIECE
jgi:hypothetical protein